MRLLVISAAFPPIDAGESEHCLQICNRLAASGVTVELITSALDVDPAQHPFQVHAVMSSWGWSERAKLLRIARQARPDRVLVIYSGWLYHGRRLVTYLPTLLKRALPGVGVATLLEIYDQSIPWSLAKRIGGRLLGLAFGGATDFFFGTLLRDSDLLLPLSETMRDRYARHHPGLAAKCKVLPPPPLLEGGALASTALDSGGALEELTLAYFGYVYRGKGVDTLFRAVALAREGGLRLRLLMVGGGEAQASTTSASASAANGKLLYSDEKQQYRAMLLDLAQRLGIADCLHWAGGYASGSDQAARTLLSAHACVLPFDDGLEMSRSSVAVAAGLGLPIISTRPARLESPFEHRRNVLLAPPGEPAALAAALAEFAGDAALRQRLREGAQALAADWYNWNRTLQAVGGEADLGSLTT